MFRIAYTGPMFCSPLANGLPNRRTKQCTVKVKKIIIIALFIPKVFELSQLEPFLRPLKKNFEDISPKLYQKLLATADEELGKDAPTGMNIPFVKENVLNTVGMFIGREDYLLGQMGLMRKLIGLQGVSHDVKNNIDY